MLVVGFPTGGFAANCYLVATAPGEPCVIIDPGQDAVGAIDDALREHRLHPAAVALTHGHLDHMWSVLPVCDAHDIPAYVHPADRHLLADPLAALPADWVTALGVVGIEFSEPDDVRELVDGASVQVAGVDLAVAHAPGHTPGSVVFTVPDAGPAGEPVLLSGDLLFAGSVGRTDLPGGDHAALLRSLATVCQAHPDATLVLPGHGPSTTIGRERVANPYLRGLAGVR